MAFPENLKSIYEELLKGDIKSRVTLFVVPLIRYKYKKSDYLYLLYRDIIEDPTSRFDIYSTSVWKHFKFTWFALKKRNVILHYHWLECTDLKSIAGMIYKFTCILLYKRFGGKLVWTVHNKMPHDGRFRYLNYKIRSSMAEKADLIHVHCNYAAQEISNFYNQPLSKFRIIQHPEYPAIKMPRVEAIKALNKKGNFGIEKNDQIFLMFGNISSYKQIDDVAEIFTKLPKHKKLIIVGPVKKGQLSQYHRIKKISSKSSNIILLPHFIPEKDVPLYHNACDCAVFNYRKILTSGGVALARSYNLPIIAPNLGCLRELQGNNTHLFDSREQLFLLLSGFSSENEQDA